MSMPGVRDLTNIWQTIKEIDLRPLREQAQRGVKIAVLGRQGSGKGTLAEQMRHDPLRPGVQTMTPILLLDLEEVEQGISMLPRMNLVVLLVPQGIPDDSLERRWAGKLADEGRRFLVCVNTEAVSRTSLAQVVESTPTQSQAVARWVGWGNQRVIAGPVSKADFLLKEFVPAVMDLLPDQHLTLGRFFPLFRVPIGRHLINETCFSNATYAFSTGVAEIVPVLDIPLNVTDMFVLSKTQAFLVYKLGLALGLSQRWQDYVTEFGGVLGSGFFWRQVARQLVGLVPAWGIIPKVAVSYAGTYVVGNVVLQWYLTGRHVSRHQMRQLYAQAFSRGKHLASRLFRRTPRRLAGEKAKALLPAAEVRVCPVCGKASALDAQFCQYCGTAL